MNIPHIARRHVLLALALLLGAWAVGPLRAEELSDDMVGQPADLWSAWQAVVSAVERDVASEVAPLLEKVNQLKPSDLRLALMADRTGSVRLEQMAAAADAPAGLKELASRITNGRRQKALAEDGWHFAAIGRFAYADANFKALDESAPDPVGLLELARQNPNRHNILVKLIANTEVGPSAKRFLKILEEGEQLLRMDPHEIAANISRLAGPPRMAYNATNRLKASGEHAVPHLIQFLQDGRRRELHPSILQVLPQLGRDGLNPMCIALGVTDNVLRQVLVDALARIGYRQAVPYLAKLVGDESASGEVKAAARQAMASLGQASGGDLGGLFHDLAEDYYNHADSVKADPRQDTANVWYLRDNELRVVAVPREIFDDVMAMRCCEEALLASPGKAESTALWLAANFRREARLGLDVESDQPDALADKDATRPEGYPRAIYFARAAGAKYNHMVLARAFKDKDPGVALGAIAALSDTAGEPSLVGAEDIKQPLVQTLAFPNRQVRIKAALALGRALPKTGFQGCENVIPVLGEALVQSGRQAALIVDPSESSGNQFQAVFRAAGWDCAVGPNLHRARQNAQKANITSYDVILLASDMAKPDAAAAVADLRRDLPTAATPVLIIAKEGQVPTASRVARQATGVDVLLADVTGLGDPEKIRQQVMSRVERAAKSLGMTSLSAELSLSLALQSAEVLRAIGEGHLKSFDFSKAASALITALGSNSEQLRIRAAHALALAAGADAQSAIAEAALNAARGAAERIAAFGSLAESARRNGNLLGTGDLTGRLIEFTMNEKDLVLRAAGSKALGALDLPGNKASEIIRSQYRG
jgi:CheY-like chemotaxis protein